MINELAILTPQGKIPISLDNIFQNMYGDIMVLLKGTHHKLYHALMFDGLYDEYYGEEE